MNKILLDWAYVIFLGNLPVAINLLLVIAVITIWRIKKDNPLFFEKPWDKRKNSAAEKIFTHIHIGVEAYCFICALLIIIPVAVLFNLKYYSYINKLAERIDVVGSSVFSFTALAVGLLMVVIVFDKKYYLVFSMCDVLQNYKVVECAFMSLFSYIIVLIMQFTLINQNLGFGRFTIIEIAAMCNIAFNTYILAVTFYIMFSRQKKELEMLSQLYRSFWIDKIDTSSFKDQNNWSKAAVEINVDYLLQKYTAICQKKRIYNIDYIEFKTTIGEKKWYRVARNKLIISNIICLVISMVIDINDLHSKCVMLAGLNFTAVLVNIAIAFGENDYVRLAVLKMFFDTWGYYIRQGKNSEDFIPSVAFRKRNVYDNYIARMNSLNAFFFIWINYVGIEDCNKDFMEEVYQEVIEWIESIEYKDAKKCKNIGIYMPVFIIGFFLYQKGIEVLRNIEIYNEMKLNAKEFETMFLSHIVYLTKNSEEHIQKVEGYLDWLQGKKDNVRG